MPKERFHMLLALEAAKVLSQGRRPHWDEDSYLLGSIMPDTLFYDVPHMRLSRLGRRLHRMQGEAGAHACLEQLSRVPFNDSAARWWLLGMMTHFLADAFWHGLVNHYSMPPFWPCRYYRLKASSCHFWLESQLEAHWIPLLGPQDGFRKTLHRLRLSLWRRHPAASYFRDFLKTLYGTAPSEQALRKCLFWQATLLSLFSNPPGDGVHERLLHSRWGRPLGALLVPRASRLSELMEMAPDLPEFHLGLHPFDGRLLARSVVSITGFLWVVQSSIVKS
ncbi:MAG: zinc dependent phospholipase C family protein [Desulfosoma sp.]